MRSTVLSRRALLVVGAAGAATLLAAPTAHAAPAPRGGQTDWSRAVVESNMARNPDPATFGGRWEYPYGLFLYGQYLVYRRIGDPRYLDYIKGYVDAHVAADGTIDTPISKLDLMEPGNLLLVLHQETGDPRYATAARAIRARLDSYPRTSDGGFWHGTTLTDQLWLDGTYMVLPFLARYGRVFDDEAYASDEAARQIHVYGTHLASPTGLYFHAYDETGQSGWADPVTHHSPIFWGRSIGWYAMAMVEVLENMPPGHPQRPAVTARLAGLLTALARRQDPVSGRWYQVVDDGADPRDWLETSASCMYTYATSRAVRRGYVGPEFASVVARAHHGLLDEISQDSGGLTDLAGICVGTDVGSTLDYYLERTRATNDLHGLGSFLIMNEEVAGSL